MLSYFIFNIEWFAGFESMLWKVPITVATKGNPQAAKLVLSQQSTTVTLEGVGENDWVLVRSVLPHLLCLLQYCWFVTSMTSW